jgi:hypothetical protein
MLSSRSKQKAATQKQYTRTEAPSEIDFAIESYVILAIMADLQLQGNVGGVL